MELFIRSDDINKVVVADDKTGYAVASFYYQAGRDKKPLYDALDNAVAFIALLNPPNVVEVEAKE